MEVLVTGAMGNVGPAVVDRLARAGHGVTVIGRRAGMAVEGARYHQCDVTDFPRLLAVTTGKDAVIHLAALGRPSLGTPEALFRVNCAGSFNVYQAATQAGIGRVVSASSIHAVGYSLGVKEWPIRSFPLDEEHPTHATDAYSYSKNVLEDIAGYFWRREGISGACLRIPAVLPPEQNDEGHVRAFVARCRRELEELDSLSLRDRCERLGSLMGRLAQTREGRLAEFPPRGWRETFPDDELMAARNSFWTAVDARDSAQAFHQALTLPYEGHHVLFVNDSHNRAGLPSRVLAETFFPEADIRGDLQGTESLVSIARARGLLGFEPEYSASRFF